MPSETAKHTPWVQAMIDLNARQKNAGSWPNGIPDSFYAIREKYNLTDDDPCWVLIVETAVKEHATQIAPALLEACRAAMPLIEAGHRQLTRYQFETDRLRQETRYDEILRQFRAAISQADPKGE